MYSWVWLCGWVSWECIVFEFDIDQNKETTQKKGFMWNLQALVYFLLRCLMSIWCVVLYTVCFGRSMKTAIEPLRWADWALLWLSSRQFDCHHVHCRIVGRYLTLKSNNCWLNSIQVSISWPFKTRLWLWKVQDASLSWILIIICYVCPEYLGSSLIYILKIPQNPCNDDFVDLCWLFFFISSLFHELKHSISALWQTPFCGGRRIRNLLSICCGLLFNKTCVSIRRILMSKVKVITLLCFLGVFSAEIIVSIQWL